MDPHRVTVYYSNSDCVIGFAGAVAVALWRFRMNAEDVAELQAAALQAFKACGQPIGLVQVVPGSAIAPDGRARLALARMGRHLGGAVSHSAIVHEAEGFRAAMIRSIVTGVSALSPPGFAQRVFGRVPEAAAWMSQGNDRLHAVHTITSVAAIRAQVPQPRVVGRVLVEVVAP